MTTTAQEELDIYRNFYDEKTGDSAEETIEQIQMFFPNFSEEKPDFWDWVSYGFLRPLSPEFITCYQGNLNWEILSKYHRFGITELGVKVGKEPRLLICRGDLATLENHNTRLIRHFVVMTLFLLHNCLRDVEWLYEDFGFDGMYQGRNLLMINPCYFTPSERVYMHWVSRAIIHEGYESLENEFRKTAAGRDDGSPHMDTDWAGLGKTAERQLCDMVIREGKKTNIDENRKRRRTRRKKRKH